MLKITLVPENDENAVRRYSVLSLRRDLVY